MKQLILIFTLTISFFAQIQSGPMLGYSEMSEVLVWLQTKKAAKVQLYYWPKGNKKELHKTEQILTKKKDFFTAKLIADEVKHSSVYEYKIILDEKAVDLPYKTEFQSQKLFQWREKIGIHPPKFSFVLGSCFYVNEADVDRPGKGYGSNYQIVTHINAHNPDFMLWLGDNTYLREVDWYSRTGFGKRYTHTRSLEELQPLLASTHHYAGWDDHDYGPNDADRSFILKNTALEMFKLFWGNQAAGLQENDGIYHQFQWGDLDFFVTDNRWFRAPNNRSGKADAPYLGEKQLNWLIDALSTSKAPFKFVAFGSQVLNPKIQYEYYANYKKEREQLFAEIAKNKIEGVVFLSGDVHHSEVNKIERKNAYPFYEITSSSLTAGTYNSNSKEPVLVKGSVVNENNFAKIDVSGKRKNRRIKLTYINAENKELYSLTINENDLKYKK